jgi:hypothetical protein
LDVYKKNQPILIATKNILMNAVANEKILYEKAEIYQNGDKIILKDLIDNYDWKRMKKEVSDELESYGIIQTDVIDGVKIKNLIKFIQPNNTTIIGKMIKVLYKYGRLEFNQFKKLVDYSGTDEQFRNNIDNARGIKCQYGKLWNFEKDIISINKRLQKYFE